MSLQYRIGFKREDLHRAAELYDEAFGAKFALAITNRRKRVSLLESCFDPQYAVSAYDGRELIGLAGFHIPEGSLTGGMDLATLVKELGLVGGLRAAVVFSLYERRPADGELLMDGIAVSASRRGMGVGTRLLEFLLEYAEANDYATVRLDVVDINSAARRLYERVGFETTTVERFPYLRWLLGFSGSRTMVLRLNQ